jgi:hypothetical protein
MDNVDIVWFWNDRCAMRVPVRILGLIFLLWGAVQGQGQTPERRVPVPPGAAVRIASYGFGQSSGRPKVVRHPLPADARIVLGKSTTQDKEVDCSDFRLGAWGIRNRFRTYHVLGDGDMHDLYGYYPCRFDGSVIVHGRTYRFEAWSGNLLFTDFPDGEGKMLGGIPSAPLDGSDRGPVDADVLVAPKRKGR